MGWDWNKENPENYGYKKTKTYPLYFKKDSRWFEKIVVYVNPEENHYKICKYYTIPARILETFLFPIHVLISGVPDSIHSVKRLWFQNKDGSVIITNIYACDLKNEEQISEKE